MSSSRPQIPSERRRSGIILKYAGRLSRDILRQEQESLIKEQGRIPNTTLGCIRHLRKSFPATKISVELEKPAREGLQDLVPEADVIFYSKSWALVSAQIPQPHINSESPNQC